ncbi:MAG TPA: hypothetical protein ENK44_01985 [Caldithrix abyssi]|uniref:Uncharacterized protein n=1 Tax=Caldithrix abyssi TaxID=187145 RepID=A0A7V4TY63_CALAY|nr:hypothetical protein [Caldithrix abyssi]
MKKAFLFVLTGIMFLACSRRETISLKEKLQAEDLWGNPINFSEVLKNEKPTVIVPISTSNCGYCLIDGFFTEKNYLEHNHTAGGSSFHQCLFNPQLDIYTFQKHFRWKFPVLTYPPRLHLYHMDGFPELIAFRKGEKILGRFRNYALVDSLSRMLWNGTGEMIPTGHYHMAMSVIMENKNYQAVRVFPANSNIPDEILRQQKRWKGFVAKTIDQLNRADLEKHLYFTGTFSFSQIARLFRGKDLPVRFEKGRMRIGSYSMNFDSTGLRMVCPNPFNRNKYLVLSLYQDNEAKKLPSYTDYVFYKTSEDSSIWLLYGHFDTGDSLHWKFSEGTAFSQINRKRLCEGKCEIPQPLIPPRRKTPDIVYSGRSDTLGRHFKFGAANCRFPDVLADPNGTVWLCWEEDGDIHLGKIDPNNTIATKKIENDVSDSYAPRLAFAGNKLWIFYLNNRDTYYRLYAKTFDGLRLSEAILISPKEPYDVLTPAPVSDTTGNEITVAWSAWLANYRRLYYRNIKNGVLSPTKEIRTYPSKYVKDYVNAWFPSLCVDRDGVVWAAWNQHYPAIFGLFGGRIDEQSRPITREGEKMDDWEQGGYAGLFADGRKKYVVWESNAWGSYRGEAQKIKFASYDDRQGKWSLGEDISVEEQTFLNQTPCAASDRDHTLWVAYSGRPRAENSTWGIYLTYRKEGTWSFPVLLSSKGETARSPRMTVDRKGNIWLTWHSGKGKQMRIRLLLLNKQQFLTK